MSDEQKKTILIVDDMKLNRDIIAEIFCNTFNIVEAENGQVAMDVLHEMQSKIILVILDLVMPVKNGYEVLKEIRADPVLLNIPVFVVSASGEIDGELRALELGATDFLVKPVKPHIARIRVQNILTKLENDRLLLENKILQQQNEEEVRYNKLLEQTKDRFQYIAEHDLLTTLYNREKFCIETEKLIKEKTDIKYVLVRIDIEKFKIINDIFGRKKGNDLLQIIGDEISKFVEEDGTACRIVADVFAVCFPFSENRVNDFFNAIRTRINNQKLEIEIIVNYGLYIITKTETPVDLIIDRADLALMTIKGNAVTRFAYYDEKMRANLLEEKEISSYMNTALEDEQFVLYLQPKVNTDTDSIIGAEALVRWIHPDKGMISPGKFIPIFEKNGFIMKLDEYMWEKTCQYLRKWLDQGINPCPISVNISRINLYNPQLTSILIGLIEKYNIPPELLELEITESAYTDTEQQLLEVLKILRNRGFKILMDDFGSGYSSLNMLKNIPVDVLKIDMKFLSGTDELGRSSSILTSIVRMAHWMNLSIIAEGVETREQANFLRSIGCPNVQGYLYYKPMPVAEFEEKRKESFNKKNEKKTDSAKTRDAIERYWTSQNERGLLENIIIGALGIYEKTGNALKLLRSNSEFNKLFAIKNPSLSASNFNILDTTFLDDRQTIIDCFKEVEKTHEEQVCTYRFVGIDKSVKWFFSRIQFLAVNGPSSMYYFSVNDITLFKNAENNSIMLAQQLSFMNEIMGEEFFDYDLKANRMDFSTQKANNEVEKTKLEDFLNQINKSKQIHPDDKTKYIEHIKEASSKQTKGELEFRMLFHDNKYQHYRATYTSVPDANGKISHIVGRLQNIENNNALKEIPATKSQDTPKIPNFLSQVILEEMEGGVGLFEYGKTIKTLYLNDGYYSMMNITREEYSPFKNDTMSFFDETEKTRLLNLLETSLKTKQSFETVCKVKTKTKGDVWQLLRGALIPYEEHNLPVFVISIIDITNMIIKKELNAQ